MRPRDQCGPLRDVTAGPEASDRAPGPPIAQIDYGRPDDVFFEFGPATWCGVVLGWRGTRAS